MPTKVLRRGPKCGHISDNLRLLVEQHTRAYHPVPQNDRGIEASKAPGAKNHDWSYAANFGRVYSPLYRRPRNCVCVWLLAFGVQFFFTRYWAGMSCPSENCRRKNMVVDIRALDEAVGFLNEEILSRQAVIYQLGLQDGREWALKEAIPIQFEEFDEIADTLSNWKDEQECLLNISRIISCDDLELEDIEEDVTLRKLRLNKKISRVLVRLSQAFLKLGN